MIILSYSRHAYATMHDFNFIRTRTSVTKEGDNHLVHRRNGASCRFWIDNWSPLGSLKDYFAASSSSRQGISLDSTLADLHRSGNGASCRFWIDNWSPLGSLKDYFAASSSSRQGISLDSTLADLHRSGVLQEIVYFLGGCLSMQTACSVIERLNQEITYSSDVPSPGGYGRRLHVDAHLPRLRFG
ncbi:hypothetical protein DY000_02023781 [Brassica cretica]|uniref:Reverse transcriptase zinc-binding domain-containing protein n=1 Tax=Brassica cretica TaxID=69181 RepID=A0ABQ7EC97_BRACR|nr:hypothetical protein DY000_02023781 [Brassica cretica]